MSCKMTNNPPPPQATGVPINLSKPTHSPWDKSKADDFLVTTQTSAYTRKYQPAYSLRPYGTHAFLQSPMPVITKILIVLLLFGAVFMQPKKLRSNRIKVSELKV